MAILLKLAENEYDVFVTVDRKLSVQQDLTAFNVFESVLLIYGDGVRHVPFQQTDSV